MSYNFGSKYKSGGGGGGGGVSAIEMCTASGRRKTGEKGMFFRAGRGTRVPRLGYQNSQNQGKGYLNCNANPRKG